MTTFGQPAVITRETPRQSGAKTTARGAIPTPASDAGAPGKAKARRQHPSTPGQEDKGETDMVEDWPDRDLASPLLAARATRRDIARIRWD